MPINFKGKFAPKVRFSLLHFVFCNCHIRYFLEFKQTCPTVPIPTVEMSNLKVTEHPMIDSKIVPLNDPRVDAAVASIVTLNNNLYNEVTNSAAELCDSATTYIRRLAQEKKKGVPVASPCIQYWEADVLISGRLKEFKKAVREELKAIMTTPASTKATPAPESKPAMVVQQENCGLTLEDLENFFTIPNCAKNPWICIPWAVLVLIAFGAMIAIIVICVNMDWSFGYNCSKRRGILRNPGSSRVRFATEDNPESGNGHGAPASASGTGRQD